MLIRLDKKTNSGYNPDDILLKEGAFDILIKLNEGPKSFIDLKNTGRSPNTILTRLRGLQKSGLVQSKLYVVTKGKKPRIMYILTAEGQELVNKYSPIKANYLEVRRTIEELEDKIFEQKKSIKLLLLQAKLRK